MGSGSYSSSAYVAEYNSRGFASKSVNQVFANKVLDVSNSMASLSKSARSYNNDVKQEMINVGVRECRDSEEHPNSTPIIIALDVTGSMRRIPYYMITEQLPRIMSVLQERNIPDPQIMFMAIGDHVYDEFPLQVGQFESDTNKILDTLESLVLEGGGGGNEGESYLLAHIVAGYHTETDSFFKRGKKGFLFTIGDEPNLRSISSNHLIQILGYEKGVKSIYANEALEKAQEQYEVYHVHVKDGSYVTSPAWKEALGDHFITCKSDDISKTIANVISDTQVGIIAPSNVSSTDVKESSDKSENNHKMY